MSTLNPSSSGGNTSTSGNANVNHGNISNNSGITQYYARGSALDVLARVVSPSQREHCIVLGEECEKPDLEGRLYTTPVVLKDRFGERVHLLEFKNTVVQRETLTERLLYPTAPEEDRNVRFGWPRANYEWILRKLNALGVVVYPGLNWYFDQTHVYQLTGVTGALADKIDNVLVRTKSDVRCNAYVQLNLNRRAKTGPADVYHLVVSVAAVEIEGMSSEVGTAKPTSFSASVAVPSS